MNRIKLNLNNRLCTLNQRSFSENLPTSTALYFSLAAISAVYFLIAISLFHSLWYHRLFAVVSTAMFAYSIQDLYFEHLEQKIKQVLPKTTKKLSHYYIHYYGNVLPAIKETEERCALESKYYLIKIRKSLMSNNTEVEVEALKSTFPFVWYRMLTSLLYMAKKKGNGIERKADVNTSQTDNSNLIGKNLMKITNIVNFINLQQGYNNAELKYIQVFLYFAPFLFIFGSDLINGKILMEMNMQHVYKSVTAQNLKAYLFLASNLSALFIHWMRKQEM